MRHQRRRGYSWAVTVLVLLATAAALSGCAGQRAEPEPSQSATRPPPDMDFGRLMHGCLAELGWETTVLPDGGIEGQEMQREQFEKYEEASEACREELGYNLERPPITREEAVGFIAAMDGAAQCLVDSGRSVPERPSDEVMIEGLMADGDPLWDPYESLSSAAIPAAQAACPIVSNL